MVKEEEEEEEEEAVSIDMQSNAVERGNFLKVRD
jgi:hypothetical protein